MSVMDELFAPMTKQMRARVYSVIWRLVVSGFAYWSLGGIAGWGFPGFARAADVQQQLTDNSVRLHGLDIRLLKLELQNNQHALFEVQSRIADKRKAGENVESIYYTEETRLTGEIADLQEKIRKLGY